VHRSGAEGVVYPARAR